MISRLKSMLRSIVQPLNAEPRGNAVSSSSPSQIPEASFLSQVEPKFTATSIRLKSMFNSFENSLNKALCPGPTPTCHQIPIDTNNTSIDVIGLGNLNIDYIGRVIGSNGTGEKMLSFLTRTAGGGAANTMCALSRLGLRTGLVGTVGDDESGRLILADLKKEGVHT